MPSGLPLCRTFMVILNFELVARYKTDIISIVWKIEVGKSLISHAFIPPYTNTVLSLARFEIFVVVGLELNQRLKNFFVLLGISVSKQDWLLRLFNSCDPQVLDVSLGLIFPHLFKQVDLLRPDLA
jgi:hypothetical protein